MTVKFNKTGTSSTWWNEIMGSYI